MKIAICCAMNQNRSTETHALLTKNGIMCMSFGTSSLIRIPGPSIRSPNLYPFTETKYIDIYNDLITKDESFYREIGMLHILERNMSIKECPENIFLYANDKGNGDLASLFDLIITCEERCFKAIFEFVTNKGKSGEATKCWVVNFDIKDTPSDAVIGAHEIYSFVGKIYKCLESSKYNLSRAVELAINEYSNEKDVELLFTII